MHDILASVSMHDIRANADAQRRLSLPLHGRSFTITQLISSSPNPSIRCDSVEKLYRDAHPEDDEDQREGVLLLDFASPLVTEHVAESLRQQGLDAENGRRQLKVEISSAVGPAS